MRRSNNKTRRKIKSRSYRGGTIMERLGAVAGTVGAVAGKVGEVAGKVSMPLQGIMMIRSAAIAAELLGQEVVKANNFYIYCQTINIDKISEQMKRDFTKMMLRLGTNIANIRANSIAIKLASAATYYFNKDKTEYDSNMAELMNITINGKDGVPNAPPPPPPPPEGFVNKAKSWGAKAVDYGSGAGFIAMCDWYRTELNVDLTNLMSIVTMIIGSSILTPTQSISVPVVTDASVIVPPLPEQPPSSMSSLRTPSRRTPSRRTPSHVTPRKLLTPRKIRNRHRNRQSMQQVFNDSKNPYNALFQQAEGSEGP